MQRQLATLILLAATAPAASQWLTLETPGIPRTADGEPDLSAPAPRNSEGRPDLNGLWAPVEVTGDLFEAENIQAWARSLMAERESSFYGDDPRFLCLPSGPAYLTAGQRRIVHSPSVVAILNADLMYRQIFLDGRELEADPFPAWMGYSVGHWDGDTLVVESNGYNDKTWLNRLGLPHTESLRITERYRRTDFGHMELHVTYEDPGTFDSPVHALVELQFAADDEMLEIACNETSLGRTHWSGEISQAQDKIVEVGVETLEKYVGTYQGTWLGNLITAEVTLEDGALFLYRNPPYTESGRSAEVTKSELIPQSETAFECSCGLGFVFSAEEDGMATEVLEVHVSGAWTFERVP